MVSFKYPPLVIHHEYLRKVIAASSQNKQTNKKKTTEKNTAFRRGHFWLLWSCSIWKQRLIYKYIEIKENVIQRPTIHEIKGIRLSWNCSGTERRKLWSSTEKERRQIKIQDGQVEKHNWIFNVSLRNDLAKANSKPTENNFVNLNSTSSKTKKV